METKKTEMEMLQEIRSMLKTFFSVTCSGIGIILSLVANNAANNTVAIVAFCVSFFFLVLSIYNTFKK